MARTKAVLGSGPRLADYLSANLLARVVPAEVIHDVQHLGSASHLGSHPIWGHPSGVHPSGVRSCLLPIIPSDPFSARALAEAGRRACAGVLIKVPA